MEFKSLKELMSGDEGSLSLIYGPTGVGKTVSMLKSIIEPCLYIRSEERETARSMKAVNRENFKLQVASHTNWEDLMEFVTSPEHKIIKPSKGILLDSISHLMNIRLTKEIQDQAWETKDEKGKNKRSLLNRTKTSEEGWGALAANMFRLCDALMVLAAKHHKTIVCIALEESRPKWNRELIGAPTFSGKMFTKNFPGFFDLIGRVSSVERKGRIVYPPRIDFVSPKNDFTAKATGNMKKDFYPLNWEKIIKGDE